MLDHPGCVERACVMDIVPTRHLFMHTDQVFATAYCHWFFLIQPDGLPEKIIGADPGWYLRECLRRWTPQGTVFDSAAVAEYERCFARPDAIHAACEDYRAGASIDLEHDAASRARRARSCARLRTFSGGRKTGGHAGRVIALPARNLTTPQAGTSLALVARVRRSAEGSPRILAGAR